MNSIQSLIDRQLGIYCRFNYDHILKRLEVDAEESFYRLQGGAVVANFEQDPPIFACRFAETGGREHILALANEDGRVAIQDTSSSAAASSLEGFQCHNNAVFDLAWMPGDLNFVTVSGDHTACLWAAGEGTPRRALVFSGHTRSVKTAAFRHTEPSVFATGGRDGHILVWDVRASPHPTSALKPDNCLMNCHSNFAAKTPGSHGKRPRVEPRAVSITGLVFQDDRTLLSCGECDGNIKVWDLRKNYNVYKREPLPKRSIPYCGSSAKNGYTNLIVDEARVRLYASCVDDVIYCFNISAYGATPERRYVGHENATFYIKTGLSPDCAYLVSGSSDKHAYVWNVKCSEPVVRLTGHRAEVTCAAWCQRGDTKIVTCSDDARHKIWRIGREIPAPGRERAGEAQPAPRADRAATPQWRVPHRTPPSRKRTATPGSRDSKRLRAQGPSARKTKRCLTDLMNAARETDEAETAVKKLKLHSLSPVGEEDELLPAGTKRRGAESSPPGGGAEDWHYAAPAAGTSFLTPTKYYDVKRCKMISPKGLTQLTPNKLYRSPERTPPKIRRVSFGTPTKDLPDFVMSGEAPHLRLMSPAKKKPDRPNWLTQLGRDKKGKTAEIPEKLPEKSAVDRFATEPAIAPSSPKESAPTRRSSISDRTPKATNKTRTLLKYFNVATKK